MLVLDLNVLRRRAYPAATYAERRQRLVPVLDEPATSVLWSPVELDDGSAASLRPIVAVVRPGEVLYLPALWWHAVSQRAGAAGGSTIAINYSLHSLFTRRPC